jgi:phosphonate transport system permease protein
MNSQADTTNSRKTGRLFLMRRRGLSFFLDWLSWGYVAYAVVYLLNHFWYTYLPEHWYDTLTLPPWGWALAVIGTLEMALWSRSLGWSLGARAFGVRLCTPDGSGGSSRQRILHGLLWHVSVLPLFVGFWRDSRRPWHERKSGLALESLRPDAVGAPPRSRIPRQYEIIAWFLVLVTIGIGWLIVQGNLTILTRRSGIVADILGKMTNPDFRHFTEPDPVFRYRGFSFSILDLAIITILMAFLGTVVGALVAFPLSFLGARNIMGFSPMGWIVYGVIRGFFNVFRSIETILWAVIFAVWVGFGSLAGIMALTIHTIAALGKLYSEQVEAVSPGPLEAVTAAGGSRWRTVRYAVIPQVVPSFLAFTLYRWDINVRMATVLALAGGGGIGDMLLYYKDQTDWPQLGAVVLVIVVIVWAMDYISGRLREKIR